MLIAVAVVALSFSSCKFVKTEAVVDVQLKFYGINAGEGKLVYLFNDTADRSDKKNAKRSIATDASGVAHCALRSPMDFTYSILADEDHTFFFVYFDEDGVNKAEKAVTISTGEAKSITLNVL